MKIIQIRPIIVLLALLVGACYEDKGNYDYHPINEVELTFPADEYNLLSLVDVLKISPEIVTKADESKFEYTWYLTAAYLSTDVDYGLVVEIDTISLERNLEYHIALDPGKYSLYYTLTNNETGIVYNKIITLNVTTQFSTGFYVLKELDGNTDMDLFFLPDSDMQGIPNVIKNLHGEAIPGAPTSFGITYEYGYMKSPGVYDATRTLNIGTATDMRVYNTQDLNVILSHTDGTLYWGGIPNEVPVYLRGHYFGISYLTSGGAYFSYQAPAWGLTGGGKFGYPEEIAGGCSPNPNVFLMDLGGIPGLQLFDEKNHRFLSVDYNGGIHAYTDTDASGVERENSPNGIMDKLIFYGGNKMASVSKQYAIFEDANDASQRYLYIMQMSQYRNPIESVKVLDKTSKFNQATMYATNENVARIIYFVYNNQLYMYDPETGEETAFTLSNIGSGEQITYISHRWHTGVTAETFSHLAVATHANGKYKMYLYNLIGPAPNVADCRILEGDGKAFRLHFVSDRMGMNAGTHGNYAYGF